MLNKREGQKRLVPCETRGERERECVCVCEREREREIQHTRVRTHSTDTLHTRMCLVVHAAGEFAFVIGGAAAGLGTQRKHAVQCL